MATAAFKYLIIANVVIGFNVSGWTQELDAGKTEFQSSCAACHGADGKGNGPMKSELRVAPPDLTVLTKKNNGVFPVSLVYEMIDGRHKVSSHGTRDMPIWGFRYTPSVREWFAQPSDFNTNLSANTEFMVRSRILALVDYLNRIQEK